MSPRMYLFSVIRTSLVHCMMRDRYKSNLFISLRVLKEYVILNVAILVEINIVEIYRRLGMYQ